MSSKFLEKDSIIQDLKILLISLIIGIGIITFTAYGLSYFITIRMFIPALIGIAIALLYGYLSNSDIKQKIIFGFIFIFILFTVDNFIGTFDSLSNVSMFLYSTMSYTLISFIFVFVGHFIKQISN
ncbi:hypothetical protein LJB96_00140 [Methanobrevibacter sp. OttesenSCG-928-K11]|nr:hypothetical protein [Methanobrevibacter sp. OttesenSCG-928-K11]